MKKFLQFNDSDIPMLVESETVPIHPNQYQVADDFDFRLISGKVYNKTKKAFFEPKVVADFDALVLQMDSTLGPKVSG